MPNNKPTPTYLYYTYMQCWKQNCIMIHNNTCMEWLLKLDDNNDFETTNIIYTLSFCILCRFACTISKDFFNGTCLSVKSFVLNRRIIICNMTFITYQYCAALVRLAQIYEGFIKKKKQKYALYRNCISKKGKQVIMIK